MDTGIGIRRHLRRHPRFQKLGDDLDAIQAALKPFVTGTYLANKEDHRREYENQGLGLSVINEIARRSGGELYVWSGRALYQSRSGLEMMPVEWPGTVVCLTLPTKLDVNVTDVVKGFDAKLQKPRIQLNFNP